GMGTRNSVFTSNWRLLSAGFLLALSFCWLAGGTTSAAPNATASAVSSYSITMTPSSTQLQVPPGGTTTGSFTVINEGKVGYNMALSVAPYYVVGANYLPKFTLPPGKTDSAQWIHLSSPATQYLKAGLPQKLGYTLTVPAGTAPGGY